MIVLKFSGGSLSGSQGFANAFAIVVERLPSKPIVVVSALPGVTTDLLKATRAALTNDKESCDRLIAHVRQRYADMSTALLAADEAIQRAFSDELTKVIHTCRSMLESLAILRELTPSTEAHLIANGPRLSATLFALAMQVRGFRAEPVHSDDVIVVTRRSGTIMPDVAYTRRKAQRLIFPLLRRGTTPIIASLLAYTQNRGLIAHLGDNGSDRTAIIIGAAIRAREVQFWTDVEGIYSCDPRFAPNARVLDTLTFHEAADVNHFGVALHRSTFEPAANANLHVRVLNIYNRNAPGTLITRAGTAGVTGPRAIACTKGVSVVQVTSRTTLTTADLAHLFSVLREHSIPGEIISLTDVSVTMAVSKADPLYARVSFLNSIAKETALRVDVIDNHCIVNVIGRNLMTNARARARVIRAMEGIKVRMALLSGSESRIGLLVEERNADLAVRHIHHELFE